LCHGLSDTAQEVIERVHPMLKLVRAQHQITLGDLETRFTSNDAPLRNEGLYGLVDLGGGPTRQALVQALQAGAGAGNFALHLAHQPNFGLGREEVRLHFAGQGAHVARALPEPFPRGGL
jgi:hypothetical protein